MSQASLCMGFLMQEYWSGLPFSPPGDLPDSGIEPVSPSLSRFGHVFHEYLVYNKPHGSFIVCVCAQLVPCVWLFATPWTIAHQTLLSMVFSRQEYWSGLPFPTLGDLPDPGVKPKSLVSPALARGFFIIEPPGKPWTKLLLLLLSHFSHVRLCVTP